MTLETRITYNPLQCGGKPCVRNMRIRVSDILQMLGEGMYKHRRNSARFPGFGVT
jgi:uncharacterized protein (DUF433 family)